ncbi:hypothetical protein BaRGS_00004902 [Batillaria attramentaria]|uniref:Ig-like domain-containing protein n=1 Tax=Batillaria attramentaria TaxID=370345 RepID=A0ABD0LVV7_9CAEN
MCEERRLTKRIHVITTLLFASLLNVLLPDLGVQLALADHGCEHNVAHTLANCSNGALDKVPYGLHYAIEELDLSNNRFTNLTEYAFKSYTMLKILRLRNNSIRSIHRDAFSNLNQLHTLDLSNNVLHSVPSEVLGGLSSLLNLNLAANNLMLIMDDAFKGLDNLKTLDLSGNRISDMDPNALRGLSKLQVLRLENNALRSLHRTTFQHLSPNLLQVHLYNNPWICDCKIRWLREWMANGTDAIWQHAGNPVKCDGPLITRGKAVNTIPLDELACKVAMRTSGSSMTVPEGAEVNLECVYFSIPDARLVWLKNDVQINFADYPKKYNMTQAGSATVTTRLHIRDFQYEDIAEYECLAENVLGYDSEKFKVTLVGVDFDSVRKQPIIAPAGSAGIDTKSVVVAVAVVCGLILCVVLGVLIFCCVFHMKRRQQERRDAVVENVKKHFMENESPTRMNSELQKPKLDHDDTNSESNRTNDTNATQTKPAIDDQYPNHVGEPVFTFQQPGSPFANGNTYVSFGSEVTDPELMPMYPQANSTRYEGSQTESTTPLLGRFTPSVFDSDGDPFDDSMHHPVYEPATMYHPRRNHFPNVNGSIPHTPGSVRSTTFIPAPRHPDYQDYRELRYPYNTPPSQRMKSMSVGNLGHIPAPRKPPRIFHSRELVEMSPHDTSGSASDYMTVPQASFYGIKPGTPV